MIYGFPFHVLSQVAKSITAPCAFRGLRLRGLLTFCGDTAHCTVVEALLAAAPWWPGGE